MIKVNAVQFAIDAEYSQYRWNFLIGRKVTHNALGNGVVTNVIVNPDNKVDIWIAFQVKGQSVERRFDSFVCKELADIEFPDVFPAQTSFAPAYEEATVTSPADTRNLPKQSAKGDVSTEGSAERNVISPANIQQAQLADSEPNKGYTEQDIKDWARYGKYMLIGSIVTGAALSGGWRSIPILLGAIGYLLLWFSFMARSQDNTWRPTYFVFSNFILLCIGNLLLSRTDPTSLLASVTWNIAVGGLFIVSVVMITPWDRLIARSPEDTVRNVSIGCGVFILICSIAAGMILSRGWLTLTILLGSVGYIIFWFGIIIDGIDLFNGANTFKSSWRLVVFIAATLAILYFGNFLINQASPTIPWARLALNVPLVISALFGLLMLFVASADWISSFSTESCAGFFFAAIGIPMIGGGIAAGMIFSREWLAWSLWLGLIGYMVLWFGIIISAPKSSLRILYFIVSNFVVLYYGNLLINSEHIAILWTGFIFNMALSSQLLLGLLLLLVPQKWVTARRHVFTFWIGVVLFGASYFFNFRYPDLLALWLVIDLVGIIALITAIGNWFEDMGYADSHFESVLTSNAMVAWISASWAIYPKLWWAWSIVAVLIMHNGFLANLKDFVNEKKESISRKVFYILDCLAVLLLFLRVIQQTWNSPIPLIIFIIVYIFLILASWRENLLSENVLIPLMIVCGILIAVSSIVAEMFFLRGSLAWFICGLVGYLLFWSGVFIRSSENLRQHVLLALLNIAALYYGNWFITQASFATLWLRITLNLILGGLLILDLIILVDWYALNARMDAINAGPVEDILIGGSIGCGAIMVVGSIAAWMMFSRGWLVWLITIGYLCFWAGFIARSPSSLWRLVFFTLSNLTILYYGNLLISQQYIISPVLALILNVVLGSLLILGLILLLVPRWHNTAHSIVFFLWMGIFSLPVSHVFNRHYPNLWALWAFVGYLSTASLDYMTRKAFEYWEYKDSHVEKIIRSNLLGIWASIAWTNYPKPWWLWGFLLFAAIVYSLIELEEFLQTSKRDFYHNLFYIMECLIVPLPALWVIWQKWGNNVTAIIFIIYVFSIWAMRRSRPTHTEYEYLKSDDLTLNLIGFYTGIACMITGMGWYFIAPEQIDKSEWLIACGFLLFYATWHERIKARAKAQNRNSPVWLNLISGGGAMGILVFGWDSPSLSRILLSLLGWFAIDRLETFITSTKKDKRPSFWVFPIGVSMFALGIWMRQNLSDAYIWQITLAFVGIWLFWKEAGILEWRDRFISAYPWGSVVCFFIGIAAFLMCMPYLIKDYLVQQTLGYNILLGIITGTIFLYLSLYIGKINRRNLELISGELVPDEVRTKILTRLNTRRSK